MSLGFGIVASTLLKGNPFDLVELPNRRMGQMGNVYLGRIPTFSNWGGANVHQIETQLKSLGLVISLLQPHEYQNDFLVTKVQPSYWEAKGSDFQHLQLLVQDEGANFGIKEFIGALIMMHCYLCDGQDVYVHCKSGMGRSATFVAAYFIIIRLINLISQQMPQSTSEASIGHLVAEVIQHMQRYRSIVYPMPCQRQFLIANYPNWSTLASVLNRGIITHDLDQYKNYYTPQPKITATSSYVTAPNPYRPTPYGHR